MTQTNCDDVYSIVEGDRVILETTEDETFKLTCTDYSTHNTRDPNIVQETRTWTFADDESNEYQLQRVDGLKRFPDQADYPQEYPLASAESPEDSNEVETFGYIKNVNIMGKEV